MALYVSRATRRWRAVLAVVATALVALTAGILIGRQMSASVNDRVASVRGSAGRVATGIERLDIEYQQVLDGTDSLQTSVLVPLDDLRKDLQSTMDRAPWLRPADRSTMLDGIAQLEASARAREPMDTFAGHIRDAAAAVRSVFGIAATG